MSRTLPTGMQARATARRAGQADPIGKAARLGFVAKGLVYGLIGLLAANVALGAAEERTDQKGALQTVAEQPGGSIVLWAMVVGFVGYGLWRFSEALWGRREESDEKKRTVKRIGSALNGLVYVGFAILTWRTVTGGGAGGSGKSATAEVLQWPGGEVLVGLAGLVVIGIAVGLTWRGLRTDFEKHLDTARMGGRTFAAVRRLGQVGYVARGVVFALVGALVVTAAVGHEPGKAAGFDVALKSLAQAPSGPALLLSSALGLVCFGTYCLAEARYRRL